MRTWNLVALALALLFVPRIDYAAPAIFSGNDVKILKDNLDLNGKGKILSGTTDPTSSAVSAPLGALYMNTSNGNLYRKLDAGSSTNWQRVGSTSGVAGSLLSNPDWETSTSGWTASGGTYTRTTTFADIGSGTGAGSWDPSASSQTLTADAVAIPAGLYGRNGLLRCNFKTAATDLTLQAYDGTNVLASSTVANGSTYRTTEVNFTFPTSGNIVPRLVSASDSVVTYLDDCYVGDASNLTNVGQAKLYGTAKISGCSSAWTTTSTTIAAFSAVTGCTYTLTGNATQPSTNIPGLTFSSLPPGEYLLVYDGGAGNTTAGKNAFYQFYDGTSLSREKAVIEGGSTTEASSTFTGSFSYTTAQSNITFSIRGATSSAGTAYLQGQADPWGVIKVYYFPSASQQALSIDQAGWSVQAQISGVSSISLSTGNVASLTDIASGSLSLTAGAQSAGVQIACASGTDSTGTTCSAVNEVAGITFTNPYAGQFLACVTSSHVYATASGAIDGAYFIVETTPTSSAAVQTAAGAAAYGTGNLTNTQPKIQIPVRFCTPLYFANVSRRTLRLQYKQVASGTVSTNDLVIAESNNGQQLHWEVYPVQRAWPMPLIVGGVSSNSSGQERVERALLNCDAGSAITSQTGSWVSSIGNVSGGQCAVTLAAGIFSSTPTCVASDTTVGGTPGFVAVHATSATAVEIDCASDAGAACSAYDPALICMGPK